MTRAFAKGCESLGIRVNALLPGLTKTKLAGALFANARKVRGAHANNAATPSMDTAVSIARAQASGKFTFGTPANQYVQPVSAARLEAG